MPDILIKRAWSVSMKFRRLVSGSCLRKSRLTDFTFVVVVELINEEESVE